MSDPTAGIRTIISRLRPFERLDTGRRVLALTTLAHLAQQVGQAGAWHAIRDRVAHGKAVDIGIDLEALATQVEERIPALCAVLTGGLITDARHAGAALPDLVRVASSLTEDQRTAAPSTFAALFEAGLAEMSQGAVSGALATSPSLARLIVDLLELDSAMSVFDPGCGLGAMLAQAARRHPEVVLFGQELNALLAALTRLRLHLLGALCEIRIGDALSPAAPAFIPRMFDRVVCDPPIGARIPKAHQEQLASRHGLQAHTLRSETLFLLYCLEAIAANGRAVVLMPVGFLFLPADKEVRTWLLEQGRLEGVVSLPTGVLAWTELAFALVILRGEPARDAPVTLVDGERLRVSTHRGAERLTENQITRLAQSYRGKVATEMVAHPSRTELLARDANLRPQAWVARTVDDNGPSLGELYRAARRAEDMATRHAQQLDNLSVMMRLKR